MTDNRTYRELDDANEWPTGGAAERLTDYIAWFGDGIIDNAPRTRMPYEVCHSRDINAVVQENERLLDHVEELEAARERVNDILGEAEWNATRWEHPLEIPSWVGKVRAALAAAPAVGEEKQ